MNSILSALILSAALFSTACGAATTTGEQKGASPSTPPAVAAQPAPSGTQPTDAAPVAPAGGSEVFARINDIPITDAEITERVKGRLKKLETQIFEIKRDGLDEMISEKILEAEAKKKNLSVDDYLKKEVDDKIADPSEEEIQTFYGLMKNQIGDQPLDQVRGKIVSQIKNTRKGDVYSKLLERLENDAKVEVYMERPRIEVGIDDDATKGKKDAPITVIEFSDFQCPFCKRARATVNEILSTYGNQVQYAFRDFPLSFHKLAPKAHEACECAGDQGKYWECNALLWEKQPELAVDKLKEYARTLGLDGGKFDSCLDSGKNAAEVEKDIQDGAAAGVSGTPAYFINGIMISGAQPFPNFKKVIDGEIKEKKRAKN